MNLQQPVVMAMQGEATNDETQDHGGERTIELRALVPEKTSRVQLPTNASFQRVNSNKA